MSNLKRWLAFRIHLDLHRPRGMHRVNLQKLVCDASRQKRFANFHSPFIVSNTAGDNRTVS